MFTRLENIINWFVYSVLHLDTTTHFSQALNFFLYDSIKIILLLILITNIMTLINLYLPIEKIRDFLAKNKLFWLEYIFSSFFGAITPFCSCSSIPLFVWFIKWWIPLWVTFSFLITSPLVNEVAVAMFLGIFWLKVTTIYMWSWIILWTFGWWVLGRLGLERYLADFVRVQRNNQESMVSISIPFRQRIKDITKDARSVTIKIIPYVLIGVAVGAGIHGFVPIGFFEHYISKDNLFAVPLAVILWIPMYANATSIIPIVQALIAKGIPLGTGLAFMMATVGLSLPEFLILKKVMKMKLLFIFFWVTWLCMILLWYMFNIIL